MSTKLTESIFERAIGLPDDERDKFLDAACHGQSELKRRVELLIAAHENPDSFLNDVGVDETRALPMVNTDMLGQQIGPYKLLQELGEGGMGLVYLAERQQPVKQRVALKIIKLGMDSKQFIARFEAERQALAIMDHPNVAKVMDAGCTDSGRPYFVMELVKGIPITRFCDENKLSTRQRLELFKQVCLAIHHAHQKGIIHRDIKPSNVLVALYDDRPVPKVIDFGVAKATNQQLTDKTLFTEIGAILGTWEYMSPEQAVLNQLDVDTRTDVYSLGVLLYELLTGVTPLDRTRLRAHALEETLRLIREEEPQKPSTRVSSLGDAANAMASYRKTKPESLAAEIRGDLDWIVMKSLEKERRKRYESALDFAHDIQRYNDDQPVSAGRPTFAYRFKKFVRRNKAVSAIGGTVLSLTALALVLTLVGISNYRIKEKVADQNLAWAIESAAVKLGRAENSPVGQSADWITARASRQRIVDLLENSRPSSLSRNQAKLFLQQFDGANDQRMLSEELENVIITGATHDDVQSWKNMEMKLRDLFHQRGMDFEKNSPREIAQKIRTHHSATRLSDALDLWIATRSQLAAMTGTPTTRKEMQPWAEALYLADPDPIRTGIRKVIQRQRPASKEYLESLINHIDLRTLEPRTLSWLAITFIMAGEPERSNEIHRKSLYYYPDDLMVNFDFALALARQGNWEHAIRYYMRCTAIRPDVAGVWRELGNSLRQTGELEESREALEHAVNLQPDYGPIYVDLAKTKLQQNEFHDALDSARQAITLDDTITVAYACLGEAHMGLKNYSDALGALQEFKKRADENQSATTAIVKQVDEWIIECREQTRDANK